jgi:hypothetical protein
MRILLSYKDFEVFWARWEGPIRTRSIVIFL